MAESFLQRTWAEIDLDRIAHNYRILRRCAGENARFLGVVKANAYGCGAVQVSRKLEELGADYLAVACLDEVHFIQTGDRQIVSTQLLQLARHLNGTAAVCICLDYAQKAGVLACAAAQDPVVMGDAIQIDLRPGSLQKRFCHA